MIPHITFIEYKSKDQVLVMTFSNDVIRSVYVPTLRGFCPCARCQGHGAGPHRWVENLSAEANNIDTLSLVGNYAINIVWEDGHDTGIYTFANLIVWPEVDAFTPELTAQIKEGDTFKDVLELARRDLFDIN